MEFIALFQPLNYLAVIAAAIAQFALGFFWYSPTMFAESWLKDTGFKELKRKGLDMQVSLPVSLVLYFFISLVLAMLLGQYSEISSAVNMAVIIGIFFVSALMAVHHLFEARSLRLFIINAGYNVFSLLIAAIIITAWQ